ncbi:rod shape-determining protein MreC [Sphingoaurantiacus capsulatus]|uniref:Cell shape-determining protein MreC n=1 Tax=Sphingoaurantiacus capsulatus TaxID=1771310 RepID=A0ABV7XE18_9SPHN
MALVRIAVAIVAVFVGLVLLLMSRSDPTRGSGLRGAAMDVTAPVWGLLRGPLGAIEDAGNYVSHYFWAVDRNRDLEAELRRYRLRDQQRLAMVRENEQMKELLRVVEPARRWRRVVPIAAGSSGSYVRSAVVSGGRDQGLRIGQPVRAARGLVGRVVEVGNHSARVLLLTDASSRVPVKVLRTGRPAIIAGINDVELELRYVAPADGQLKVGDRLVTSGDGGIFPPDVPVAVVTRVLRDVQYARPLAHPEGLGYVIVEQPYLPPVVALPQPEAAAAPPAAAPVAAAPAAPVPAAPAPTE